MRKVKNPNRKETVMGEDGDGGGIAVDGAWCNGGVWVVGW